MRISELGTKEDALKRLIPDTEFLKGVVRFENVLSLALRSLSGEDGADDIPVVPEKILTAAFLESLSAVKVANGTDDNLPPGLLPGLLEVLKLLFCDDVSPNGNPLLVGCLIKLK